MTTAQQIVAALLEGGESGWVSYDQLKPSERYAIDEWLGIVDGFTAANISLDNFVFRVEEVTPNRIVPVLKKWQWNWNKGKSIHHDTESRVGKIQRLQQGGTTWPYVVGDGTSFEEWAKDSMNHGDGWHRLILALRKNRPIDFIYIKRRKRGARV